MSKEQTLFPRESSVSDLEPSWELRTLGVMSACNSNSQSRENSTLFCLHFPVTLAAALGFFFFIVLGLQSGASHKLSTASPLNHILSILLPSLPSFSFMPLHLLCTPDVPPSLCKPFQNLVVQFNQEL